MIADKLRLQRQEAPDRTSHAALKESKARRRIVEVHDSSAAMLKAKKRVLIALTAVSIEKVA